MMQPGKPAYREQGCLAGFINPNGQQCRKAFDEDSGEGCGNEPVLDQKDRRPEAAEMADDFRDQKERQHGDGWKAVQPGLDNVDRGDTGGSAEQGFGAGPEDVLDDDIYKCGRQEQDVAGHAAPVAAPDMA